ncbi:hypothetical protein JVU11DRAFT_3844 [Chiua virens]|nr:hypothetical protein JVU11DRAFT_3844 [Chiua virens]
MGRQPAQSCPAFLSSIQESDHILVENYGQGSMLECTGLFVPGAECKLSASGVWPVQEVVLSLVFIQVALVNLVRSLGITYDFVVGHSTGEIAMAAITRAEGNGSIVALGASVQKAKKMIRKVLSQAKAASGLWIAGIIELAKDPNDKVFAAKLHVTCAFHTPLMEPQEHTFKGRVSGTPLSQGTKKPIARVMSTADGKWLDRDMDVNYCSDNICRPVLFGTAINKIISDEVWRRTNRFIGPPNPKIPEQNTGEHCQFLEGIRNLLSTDFKNVDFDKLCASPDGAVDFVNVMLLEYPYNRERPCPIASSHFRVNADSHPDLTGHIVFDAVLFPASGYVESILENGAMVVSNIAIHKPLVLNGPGSMPGHAGCVINGDKWEFRAATTPHYDSGVIILDSIYVTYDERALRTFDFQSKLALSQGSVTGDEFYEVIPAACRYQDHFRNYLEVVHEIDDDASVGGKAHLTYLEVLEGTPDVFSKGYAIHPGILDSITQGGLARDQAIRLRRRVPSSRDRCHSLSDYIIANSEGKILSTIKGFETARAPNAEPLAITDSSREQRLTTMWQPKSFSSSLGSLSSPSSLRSIFESLGSMTIAILNEMAAKVKASARGCKDLAVDDGSVKYGHALVPILNDRLAYDEPYTTEASPHQYRIWLAQRERDNACKHAVSKIDANMSRFGATRWDTHEARAEPREQHLQFWAEKLDSTEPLHFTLATPSDHELAPVTQIEARIGVGPFKRYMKLITSVAATPFAGLFAAYNLLHKYSGQSTFVVGTAITHCNLLMLTNVIGFFANMLPIKTTVNKTQTFADYLKDFKTALISCLTHDEVTYEDLVSLGKSPSGSRGTF